MTTPTPIEIYEISGGAGRAEGMTMDNNCAVWVSRASTARERRARADACLSLARDPSVSSLLAVAFCDDEMDGATISQRLHPIEGVSLGDVYSVTGRGGRTEYRIVYHGPGHWHIEYLDYDDGARDLMIASCDEEWDR